MAKRIGIIGGGFMGLSAGLEAASRGAEAVVFERDSTPGGLGGAFEIGGETFERYHHFISRDDAHLHKAAAELGVAHEIAYRDTRLGYFTGDRIVPFTTPGDLLSFPGLGIIDKLRFAASMTLLTRKSSFEPLEGTSAREWIIKTQGRNTYDKIWAHLMEMKFADEVDVIPLSWFWSRSKRRASNRKLIGDRENFGVFKRSASVMADAFVREIEKRGGKVRLSTTVNRIVADGGKVRLETSAGVETFDSVVVTVPLPTFVAITPGLDAGYAKSMMSIKYAAIVNMVALADREFTPYFWLNVSDRATPFPGVIEMTHLRPLPDGRSVIYVPNYIYSEHPDYALTDEQWAARFLPALERINPKARVLEWKIFRDKYADPYYSLHYSKKLPDRKTPIPGVFLANTSQVYPVTRSLNNSIWWGREVASTAVG